MRVLEERGDEGAVSKLALEDGPGKYGISTTPTRRNLQVIFLPLCCSDWKANLAIVKSRLWRPVRMWGIYASQSLSRFLQKTGLTYPWS